MKFRPCIDIHNGKVKQIVGGSLKDEGNQAAENFVSEKDAGFYAALYRENGLKGGHIILLNAMDSSYYEEDQKQAMLALAEFPGGLQIGGGITEKNASRFLRAGASHVIVTSYVFKDGKINYENLKKIGKEIGRENLVLDLSCRRKGDDYYIVTDRWQKFTDVVLSNKILKELSAFCVEYLIHAVDVEGQASGIEEELVKILAQEEEIPITYAGGIGSFKDIECLRKLGKNRIDVTVGSALDLFGGNIPFDKLLHL